MSQFMTSYFAVASPTHTLLNDKVDSSIPTAILSEVDSGEKAQRMLAVSSTISTEGHGV